MKIVGINSHPGGSTKNIMINILDVAEKEIGSETYAFWGNWKTKEKGLFNRRRFGFYLENAASGLFSRFTGIHGEGSILGTLLLIQKLKRIRPDIIHIHNIHLWTINIPLLFRYIKKNKIKVVWTLHDCWTFTGHCTHFLQTGCSKWISGCYDCNSLRRYPFSYRDKSAEMWNKKKKWFSDLEDLIIITPSVWLSKIVRKSFLRSYEVRVINNGIDLSVFRPIESKFRTRHSLKDKFIVLGVAFQWGHSKGLDIFEKLYRDLNKEKYAIVLVGTSEMIEKELPKDIITIRRTSNQKELAQIYSAANVFVNPTREDNFPTTNIESLACGTPVITFDVGGCAEIIDNYTGVSVPCNDYNSIKKNIIKVCEDHTVTSENCRQRARSFNAVDKYHEYCEVYKELMSGEI